MPSTRGSSHFKPVKGITIYGPIGLTGPTGNKGLDKYGVTGATADKYLSGISLNPYFKLITTFLNGTTFGATGSLYGITGDTLVRFDGRTASGGTMPILVGATGSERVIEIRKIKGSTGYRSYVQVTADSQNLYLNIERNDGEYTLHTGQLAQIIATDSSLNLIGITSAFYGNLKDTVEINKVNFLEKTRGGYYSGGSITSIYGQATNPTVIKLHPLKLYSELDNNVDRRSNAKVYAIDLNQFISSTPIQIIIDAPPENPIGFSLYVQGGRNPCNYSLPIFSCPTDSGGSVIFPFNKQPCFQAGQKYLIHFISVNKTWYGYIFGNFANTSTPSYFCDCGGVETLTNQINSSSEVEQSILLDHFGITGACCKNGSCEITPKFLCDGFFMGKGTTCGVTGTSPCETTIGSCCIKITTDGKTQFNCIDNISPYVCANFNSDSVTTIYSAGKTCVTVNCQTAHSDTGACCDGFGLCSDKTEIECIKTGKSFLGKGSLCYSELNSPSCASGFGACCGITSSCFYTFAENCFYLGGKFMGEGVTCSGITCSTKLDCCSYLDYSIKPGDLFGGGIVVGIYNPKTSKLLGAKHAFSKSGITLDFLSGGETLANYYQSEYDYIGYGFTGDTCISAVKNETKDSYYLIAALQHVTIDEDGNLVNPTTDPFETELFSWYGSGIAWGPLLNLNSYSYDDFTYLAKTYDQYYLSNGEGYYGITGDNLDNIIDTTIQTCRTSLVNGTDPVSKLFAKNVKGSNGLWNRNWGIYNTIRMISADNAHHLRISRKPYFDYKEFDPGLTMTSVHALKLFSNDLTTNSYGLTANPSQLSDWYIPSHDELAFIAANCIADETNRYSGFNLNAELLVNNGIPFDGWYWSSTGSFDETDALEGIYVSGKPKHGSVAWAISFDVNGTSLNFKTKKEKRSNLLKVRPVRAIRCDGLSVNSSQTQYKLWKTPLLLRNRI